MGFSRHFGDKGPAAIRIVAKEVALSLDVIEELTAEPSPNVRIRLYECTRELLHHVSRHPEFLREMHPGAFEALVAEIYRAEGFETELISNWNEADGGVDLVAVREVSPGQECRIAVQCKRWNGRRQLSAEPIRSLAGVLDKFQAHIGVVATTGWFSRNAEEEKNRYFWRISLRDYSNIIASLKRTGLVQR